MPNYKFTRSIAIVGAGYWGKNLVRNFYNLGSLHTICDNNTDTLRIFREHYPNSMGTASYTDVLANPEINGVATGVFRIPPCHS